MILVSNLDYSNCKCRKKLVDKLVEECTGNIEKTKLIEKTLAKNEHENKFSSCGVYIVLLSIILAFNIGIGTHFVYCHWYLKKNDAHSVFNSHTETTTY